MKEGCWFGQNYDSEVFNERRHLCVCVCVMQSLGRGKSYWSFNKAWKNSSRNRLYSLELNCEWLIKKDNVNIEGKMSASFHFISMTALVGDSYSCKRFAKEASLGTGVPLHIQYTRLHLKENAVYRCYGNFFVSDSVERNDFVIF